VSVSVSWNAGFTEGVVAIATTSLHVNDLSISQVLDGQDRSSHKSDLAYFLISRILSFGGCSDCFCSENYKMHQKQCWPHTGGAYMQRFHMDISMDIHIHGNPGERTGGREGMEKNNWEKLDRPSQCLRGI